MRTRLKGLLMAVVFLSGPALAADVRVEHAWIRATAPGQSVAGAFLDLTADADARLIGAECPAAVTLELHTMSMKDGMMTMRRVKDIALPKGRTVSLRPGGLHIMLIGLKAPLRDGDQVPLTLRLRDAKGRMSSLRVQAAVYREGGELRLHHRP